MSEKLLLAFKPFETFSKAMLDAYIILDATGHVVKSNPLFSQLVGISSKQILKTGALSELIQFQLDGKPLEVADLLANQSPTRIDEVNGKTATNENLILILGLYPFVEDGNQLGLFLLIRDVTAETNLQDKYKVKATQSVTDRLTGLYNRGYFDGALPELVNKISLSRREADKKAENQKKADQNLSLIMADIDHFKKINDTYGHQGGDFVLEKIAAIFKSKFRKTDIICRYGGEEFLVILPYTGAQEAYHAAEKLRIAVASFTFDFNGTIIPVTISMGISQLSSEIEESGDTILSRADEALYSSKKNGRNRITIHGEPKE